MSESTSAERPAALLLAAGADRFGEQRGLGISSIAFKVTTPNPSDLFILENTFLAKGGPARHLHYEQEEWFYILEGEFLFEVGAQRFHLHPGESLLAPRQVPQCLGLYWGGPRPDSDRVSARWEDGSLLPRSDHGQRDAPSRSGVMACPWAWSCWDRLCLSSRGWSNDAHCISSEWYHFLKGVLREQLAEAVSSCQVALSVSPAV